MTTSIPLLSLLVSLVVSLTEGTDLTALCNEILTRPTSYRIQLMCDELATFLNKVQRENEVGYAWVPSSIRNSRDTTSAESALHDKSGMLLGLRVRRGGNYIRFGRSISSSPAVAAYLHSFGNRDSRSDGHYVRFGRSIPDTPVLPNNEVSNNKLEDKRFMRFGKKAESHFNQEGDNKEKRFMRFGRDPDQESGQIDEEKRFMRFGKKDTGMADGGNKRFMRFGKREHSVDATDNMIKEEDEKRFMRFGRGGSDRLSDKRFMRFGKRKGTTDDLGSLDYESAGKRFMRFGKRTESEIAKRFMRFGKRGNNNDEEGLEENEQKRFMRFGKRFMRFGRGPQDQAEIIDEVSPVDNKDITGEKRFMRFGKRGKENDHKDNIFESSAKRFMRFGKKDHMPVSPFGSDKRFMRFGKREDDSQ